ncbi:hypothetical protein [Propionibacterium freudenreichii]|uniref:hypothetical protein n=1 Tax=Propionibacterium freudenreichii TaxID=1744 RepID=UPI0022FD433F|nr:hypothetical protein [Propionibacterium freudenreichii]MDK9647222.1 hypothetical protein [Propionibacterium freudenreichii]
MSQPMPPDSSGQNDPEGWVRDPTAPGGWAPIRGYQPRPGGQPGQGQYQAPPPLQARQPMPPQHPQAPMPQQRPQAPMPQQPQGRPQQPPRYSDEARNDARASLEAFGEMGPQYSDAVIDSFLARVDSQLGAQHQQNAEIEKSRRLQEDKRRRSRMSALPTALVFAIPLTAIASDYGLVGMAMAWVGVLLVAFITTGFKWGRDDK